MLRDHYAKVKRSRRTLAGLTDFRPPFNYPPSGSSSILKPSWPVDRSKSTSTSLRDWASGRIGPRDRGCPNSGKIKGEPEGDTSTLVSGSRTRTQNKKCCGDGVRGTDLNRKARDKAEAIGSMRIRTLAPVRQGHGRDDL